jgi:dihydroxy-acid dehydratase
MISCRTLYKANGFGDDDFKAPVIGIANSFSDIVPGHKNLREVAQQVKNGVYRAGGTPVELAASACATACVPPTAGARYSLPSRELIATALRSWQGGASNGRTWCWWLLRQDSPRHAHGGARLDIPCIFVAGGCMLGGPAFGHKTKADSTCVIGGLWNVPERGRLHGRAQDLAITSGPTVGSCQHMASANTHVLHRGGAWASPSRLRGHFPVFNERVAGGLRHGETIVRMVFEGLTSKDIITERSIENANHDASCHRRLDQRHSARRGDCPRIGIDAAKIMARFEQ